MPQELTEFRDLAVHEVRRAVKHLIGRKVRLSDGPHLDEGALAEFTALVTGKRYLEYGSGGSTIWAVKHAAAVVSVETDRDYAAQVAARTGGAVRHFDIGPTVDWGKPAFKRPTPRRVEMWRRYVEFPWTLMPDPEVVLVDGRCRAACALHSLSMTGNPVLLDDYLSRPHYRVVEPFADLRMAGRMAVLTRREDFDTAAWSRAFELALTDWR